MAEAVRKKGKKNRKHGRQKRSSSHQRQVLRELRRINGKPVTEREKRFVARHVKVK